MVGGVVALQRARAKPSIHLIILALKGENPQSPGRVQMAIRFRECTPWELGMIVVGTEYHSGVVEDVEQDPAHTRSGAAFQMDATQPCARA